jgi:hypothetical protein
VFLANPATSYRDNHIRARHRHRWRGRLPPGPGPPRPRASHRGRRYRIVDGWDAELLVDGKTLQKVVESRRHVRGRNGFPRTDHPALPRGGRGSPSGAISRRVSPPSMSSTRRRLRRAAFFFVSSLVLLATALLVRLASGPISLDLLRPHLEHSLDAPDGSFASTWRRYRWSGTARAGARAPRDESACRRAGGERLAEVPVVAVRLATGALLRGLASSLPRSGSSSLG